MIYLLLAILSSASLALGLRISEDFCNSRYGILFGNYFVCALMAFFFLPVKNIVPAGGQTAIVLGVIDGIIYLITLVLMQYSIKRNGAVLTAAFGKMGLMVPVVGSILFFGEKPRILQIFGMILVVVSILVINLEREDNRHRRGSKVFLLVYFFFSGMADGMSKVFEHLGEREFDELFLFYAFFTAAALALVQLIREQRDRRNRVKVSAVDLITGMIIGVPNYFSASLLLAALTRLPAYITYPCFSVGTILVVSFVGLIFLGERMTRRQTFGCGIILLALVCLNI